LAVLHKTSPTSSETDPVRVVGEVRDRPCLIVDDIITTGTTLARAVDALSEAGARPECTIAATHGLLLSGARESSGTKASVRCSSPTPCASLAPDGRNCGSCRWPSGLPADLHDVH
jgi:ribose-phosphate pyrophosphokinase